MISVSRLATYMPFVTLPLAPKHELLHAHHLPALQLATVSWVAVDTGAPLRALGWKITFLTAIAPELSQDSVSKPLFQHTHTTITLQEDL